MPNIRVLGALKGPSTQILGFGGTKGDLDYLEP